MTPQPCEIVASKIASSSVIPVTPNTLLNILSSCSFSDLSPTNASGTLECIVEHGKSALASSIPPRGFFARPLTFEAKKVMAYIVLLILAVLVLIAAIVSSCQVARERREKRERRERRREMREMREMEMRGRARECKDLWHH